MCLLVDCLFVLVCGLGCWVWCFVFVGCLLPWVGLVYLLDCCGFGFGFCVSGFILLGFCFGLVGFGLAVWLLIGLIILVLGLACLV